jgi:hypothetical protein
MRLSRGFPWPNWFDLSHLGSLNFMAAQACLPPSMANSFDQKKTGGDDASHAFRELAVALERRATAQTIW